MDLKELENCEETERSQLQLEWLIDKARDYDFGLEVIDDPAKEGFRFIMRSRRHGGDLIVNPSGNVLLEQCHVERILKDAESRATKTHTGLVRPPKYDSKPKRPQAESEPENAIPPPTLLRRLLAMLRFRRKS